MTRVYFFVPALFGKIVINVLTDDMGIFLCTREVGWGELCLSMVVCGYRVMFVDGCVDVDECVADGMGICVLCD